MQNAAMEILYYLRLKSTRCPQYIKYTDRLIVNNETVKKQVLIWASRFLHKLLVSNESFIYFVLFQ